MNSSNILISIIIPVYNCQDYIEQCLESVLDQTIKEIEIICVDDGSTDNSVSIIQEFVYKDNRIILLHQKNQGSGSARNRGVQSAKGKYISFLDADDFFLDADALEKMYFLCNRKNIAVCGSFRKNLESYGLKETHIIENDKEYAKTGAVLNYLDYQFDYEYQNFIFLKKLLTENNIKFPNYRRYQDPPFLVRALYAARKFTIADTYLYCYRAPNAMQRSGAYKTTEMLNGIIDNLNFAAEYRLDILFRKTVKHLDYERRYLITFDLEENDTRIIEKLLEATKIIREYYKKPDYIVNPLKDIISGYLEYQSNYKNYVKKILNQNQDIIVYGAGNLATIFLEYLVSINMEKKVKYVMVSSEVSRNADIQGVPIISIKDKKKCEKLKDTYVFIATTGAYHEEIINILKKNGFNKYEAVNDAFLFEYANTK